MGTQAGLKSHLPILPIVYAGFWLNLQFVKLGSQKGGNAMSCLFHFRRTLVLTSYLLLLPLTVIAAEEGRYLEEIVVTANKTESLAQDTGIALTPLSREAIRDAGGVNIEDLARLSPSTDISTSSGQFVATIRGVGNQLLTTGIGEAGVAVHINGVYQGLLTTTGGAFFDLDRVEILRGPQGTLWGRNSTGGAINIIQKRPTTEFEGYLDVSYGEFDTSSIETALSGSLSEAVQGRLAVRGRKSDGYLEDLSGNGDLGDDDSLYARGSVNFDFGWGSWLLAAGYSDRELRGHPVKAEGTALMPGTLNPFTGQDGTLSYAAVAFGPQAERGEFETFATNPAMAENIDGHYVTSELELDFENVGVFLLTDYREHDRVTLTDIDHSPQSTFESFLSSSEESEEFSQEIRFVSDQSNALRWQVGAFYYRQDLSRVTDLVSGPFPGVPDVVLFSLPSYPRIAFNPGGDLEVRSWSVFGQAAYDFSERLTLTAGLRYSKDEKETEEFTSFSFDPGIGVLIPLFACPGPACPFPATAFDDEWDNVTGKIGLEYHPVSDVLLFANVARGAKSGGIQLGSLNGPFDEETLWSYEAGIKSTFMNGRARLGLTAFYSDFEGYQLQVVQNIAVIVINADADVTGVEAELTIVPTETVRVDLVASWNDSEITNYPPGLANPTTGAPLFTGEPLPTSPEITFRLGLQKDFLTAGGNRWTIGTSYYWQDDVNLDPFGTFGGDEDSYGLWDAFIRLTNSTESWSIDVFGTNLTDEFYKKSIVFTSLQGGGGTANAFIAPSRQIGVRARLSF